MIRRSILLTISILSSLLFIRAQQPDFIPPVDFRMYLSGTFGELRPNHFHSGIDIKTGGVEGKPIRSIADGQVSRIRISPYGFGKAVYVDHPGGYTSVYAHLRNLEGQIATYAEAQQYRLEAFDVDITVPSGALPVKQGDIIGLSGNSGSSGGPHLHFEIRDAATQEPLNPMHLGMDAKDFIRPTIKDLKIYPEGEHSRVNNKASAMRLPVLGWGESHRIETRDTLRVKGAVSFGLHTYDLLNESSNHNGVYSIEAYIDDRLFYAHRLDRFSFAETRYLNALIDYEEYVRSGKRFQRTRILPNNKLSIYDSFPEKGVLNPLPGRYEIRFVVKDHKMNESILRFPIIFEALPEGDKLRRFHQVPAGPHCLSYARDYAFKEDGVQMWIPGAALYDTVCLTYRVEKAPPGTYAPLHHIHHPNVPLHTFCNLNIKALSLPENLHDKAIIVRKDDKGKFKDADGHYADGWVKTRVRDFGSYTVMVDTIPPKVRSLNVAEGQRVREGSKLQFMISDELSGIHTYRMEMNGNWVLAEYDPKRNLLEYTARAAHFIPGANTLTLEVSDDKANKTTVSLEVIL